jgi:hypothetical protein
LKEALVGTFALIDARIEINSVVMSGDITSVTLPIEFEELEDTAFGDVARSRLAGLQDSTLGLNFNQDMDDGAVDELIYALLGTVVEVKVRKTSAAISAANPEYVGSYLVSQWSPFGNAVGEKAAVSTAWPLSDPTGIARNVA